MRLDLDIDELGFLAEAVRDRQKHADDDAGGSLRALQAKIESARVREPVKMSGRDGHDDSSVDIVVYSQKWNTDRPGAGDDWNASIHSRVVVNGQELVWVSGVTVDASGLEFTSARLSVLPRQVRFVALDPDDWAREDLSGFDAA